jgi:orotate phosphoribosyltransferase
MLDYQREFIEFAIEKEVLCFGEFTLKSGRKSPYFFNSALFSDGASLLKLGNFYARAIEQSQLKFDMIYGPAYKGIPLAAAVAIAYGLEYGRALPYCFNRKEEKDHGEGGTTLGAPLKDSRVLVVDDVISAGTSVNQSVAIIRNAMAHPVGVAVALDRQERGQGDISAVQEVEQKYGLQVISVITLDDLVDFLQVRGGRTGDLERIQEYRTEYGIG